MRALFIFIFTFMGSAFLTLSSSVDESNIVAVGEAELEKDKITFLAYDVPKGLSIKRQALINEFHSILFNDFSFYRKRFEVIKTKRLGRSFGSPNMAYWEGRVRYLGQMRYTKESYEAKVYDMKSQTIIASLSGSLRKKDIRFAAHELTHNVYKEITEKDSIFLSKIIFVSDRHGSRKNPVKELYIMDFDGKNARRLTYHRGTVISPAFSLDGKKVLYSLIRSDRKKRNVNLRILNIKSGKTKLISKRSGINSGAVFMPDGKHIMLTLSHQGNAELYQMNLRTRKHRRVTKHYAPDVDPSISVAGNKMAFLSGRSGRPMIYTMDPRQLEKDVKRVSFVGQFNATPRFTPDGQQIAFSSWLDNRFDIFRIDADGSNLYRLTKDFGSNEDPTYSNDGQFIAFSSQRVLSKSKAVQNIYIMTSEGEVLGKLTNGIGNCITPRWSK